MATLVQGDYLSKIRFSVRDEGTPVNLTGSTISFIYQISGGAKKTITPITIVDPPTAGICEYQWSLGDIYDHGTLVGNLSISSGGRVGPTPRFYIPVKRSL